MAVLWGKGVGVKSGVGAGVADGEGFGVELGDGEGVFVSCTIAVRFVPVRANTI